MLYQLTTHLFNPNSKTNKVDYYEVLGLSRTASSKVNEFVTALDMRRTIMRS